MKRMHDYLLWLPVNRENAIGKHNWDMGTWNFYKAWEAWSYSIMFFIQHSWITSLFPYQPMYSCPLCLTPRYFCNLLFFLHSLLPSQLVYSCPLCIHISWWQPSWSVQEPPLPITQLWTIKQLILNMSWKDQDLLDCQMRYYTLFII